MLEHLHPDQPITLNLHYTLASCIGMTGDSARARKLGAALVDDFGADAQRILGPDDRHTLATRADLARWTGEAGDVVSAREMAQTLVEDDERVLSPDHRHTLLARGWLSP